VSRYEPPVIRPETVVSATAVQRVAPFAAAQLAAAPAHAAARVKMINKARILISELLRI
jgi:hypothetical protein